MRFIDIPEDEQNAVGGDTADYGLQMRYNFDPVWHYDAELMTDGDNRFHANFRLQGLLDYGDLEVRLMLLCASKMLTLTLSITALIVIRSTTYLGGRLRDGR
ncbi:hypothetical protein JCM19239_3738 [Vibrio variabilis]|uniref:Uncharacterized protein n=1 Tax=Vibrio variabilis TaxID=990271 RepID=A0ABQ0J9M5_9VIBR|nr:hypothetical protein JCM19239_3738 [Vibrio variabilis]